MANFVIMFVCLVAGGFIRRRAKFSIKDVRPINIVVLWLSLPAVVFTQVPPLIRSGTVSTDFAWAVATPWFNFLVVTAAALATAKWCGWSRATVGALILTAGLGNTSFVGLPIIETLYGEAGLRVAILIDQLGTFLILATLGLLVASISAGRTFRAKVVAKRVLFFPPFIAIILAVIWGLSPLPTDGLVVEACRKIASTLVPLALLSVGWQLELQGATLRRYLGKLSAGLVFKLLLWPALVFAFLTFVMKRSVIFDTTVIEAAMAPMITGAVVAAEFELDSELAQLMVGIGVPFSILTLTFWNYVLKAV